VSVREGVDATSSPPFPPGTDQSRQWNSVTSGSNYFFYRFVPRVDIDNDGETDDIVIWKETGGFCGELDSGGEPIVLTTSILVLDRNGKLDMAKTREIVGHPMGPTLAFGDAQMPMHLREVSATRFRAIGKTMGIFVFKGVTYFDTFYAEGGDLENRRDGTPNYRDTLAVLRRAGGKTHLVCEILVR
jgi:hypothetical protein